ncbi:hypothetical protein [Caulobacter sp. 17J65-9]|uniref:hypothetical protein n=1 Tax=Caulobacter sp. 17J65-9 TaxID=2709382 RepID=UPI0013C6F8C4|nr:hypothetical protein [Caulobacter sp. 17J65-9]NEX95122.1 hypothetical protein [Caulobacter sp. 17J65-9]
MRAAVVAVVAGLMLGGCAVGPAAAPQPSLRNLQALRAAEISPLAVGRFTAGPEAPKRKVSIGAAVVSAPGEGTFADHLGETLAAELRAAGKFDPNSPVVVTGVLTRSEVHSEPPQGHAALTATFTVTREGRAVFEKAFAVHTEWTPEWPLNIVQAEGAYTGLYNDLVGALVTDPEFRKAVNP